MADPRIVIGGAQEIALNASRRAQGAFSKALHTLQPYLDKYGLYVLLGLFLSAVAAWGSREVHFRKVSKELTTASESSKSQLDRVQTALTKAQEQVKQYAKITTNTHTVTAPDGTVVQDINQVNQTWTETYMALMHQADAREKVLTDRIAALESQNSQLESKVVSSAPRWAATGAYDLLGGNDWREKLRLGAGLNVGVVTVGASVRPFGPAADSDTDLSTSAWWARFRPSVDAAFRF